MKPTAKEKEFIKQCNRVRALISFHKLKTIEECARELGLESWIRVEDSQLPKLNAQVFNAWLESVAERQQTPEWNDKDAWIESQIYEGYNPCLGPVSIDKPSDSFVFPARPSCQIATPLYFQENCAKDVFRAIEERDYRAACVRANTGDGKTYFAGQLLRYLVDSGNVARNSMSPWKVLYVTGPSIVDQTKEVLEEYGFQCPQDVEVTNYEALRSKFGKEKFIEKKLTIVDGEEEENWVWKPMVHPYVIFWDECHKLKNAGSIQSKIGQACNNIEYKNPFTGEDAKTVQIFMSASPFSRIVHAKVFAVATRHKWTSKDGRKIRISNGNWNSIAQAISKPAELTEYSRPAIKRFLREFKPYIFPFKNVRKKFHGILQTEFLEFETEEDRREYNEAWDKFMDFKKKIEGKDYANSRFLLLVQLGVFRRVAEKIRHRQLARKMYESWRRGKAPVAACGFKATIALSIQTLINDYNIPRSKISVIWGGSTAYAGDKERLSANDIQTELAKALADPNNVNMKMVKRILTQLQADHDGIKELDKSLRLGPQSRVQRNEERKNFQSGRTEFAFFTFGAGKEGLSLHQCEEFLRPREQFNSPVYNEMEQLQAEGRTARITSKSDTIIWTLVYKNTIEVPVLRRVMAKRQCLEVVRSFGDRQADVILDKMLDEIEDLLKIAGMEPEDAESSEEDDNLEESVYQQLEDELEGEA